MVDQGWGMENTQIYGEATAVLRLVKRNLRPQATSTSATNARNLSAQRPTRKLRHRRFYSMAQRLRLNEKTVGLTRSYKRWQELNCEVCHGAASRRFRVKLRGGKGRTPEEQEQWDREEAQRIKEEEKQHKRSLRPFLEAVIRREKLSRAQVRRWKKKNEELPPWLR